MCSACSTNGKPQASGANNRQEVTRIADLIAAFRTQTSPKCEGTKPTSSFLRSGTGLVVKDEAREHEPVIV